jgi:hypothetical protein
VEVSAEGSSSQKMTALVEEGAKEAEMIAAEGSSSQMVIVLDEEGDEGAEQVVSAPDVGITRCKSRGY